MTTAEIRETRHQAAVHTWRRTEFCSRSGVASVLRCGVVMHQARQLQTHLLLLEHSGRETQRALLRQPPVSYGTNSRRFVGPYDTARAFKGWLSLRLPEQLTIPPKSTWLGSLILTQTRDDLRSC